MPASSAVSLDTSVREDRPVPAAESNAMSLKFEIQPSASPTSDKDRAAKLVDPGFGRVFTDHMAIVRYTQGKGWHSARVESRANFPLDPALAVLHYAQEIFEGLKAYNRDDGGMNIFFVFDDGTLSTPPLGTILPGITRDSIMALAKDSGMKVREEPYTIQQWRADAASGRLKEAFACGTAAVISPIGKVCSGSGDFTISGGAAGPVAMGMRKKLVDIQYGRAPDPHNWVVKVL